MYCQGVWKQTVNKCGFYVEELGDHVIDSTEQGTLEKKETAAEDVDWSYCR